MNFVETITSRSFAIALLVLSLLALLFFKYYPDYYTNLILIVPIFIFFSISLNLYKRIKKRSGAWGASFTGSVIFHIGMLVVIGAICSGGMLRFWANVTVPRAIPVVVDGSNFTTIYSVPIFQEAPFIKITLDWQDSTFSEGSYAIDHAAGLIVGLINEKGYSENDFKIQINKPVSLEGFQFLLRGGGFVYMLVIEDSEGNLLFGDHRKAMDNLQVDVFKLKDSAFEFNVRFFPDLIIEDGKYGSKSKEAIKPALGVSIVDTAKPFDDAWTGVLKFNESASYGGLKFRFIDVRPYVSIEILKDPSYYGIIAGWLLIVLGLLMRYLFVKDMSREIG